MKNFSFLSVFIGIVFLLGIQSCRESKYTIPSEFTVVSDNGGGTGTTTWKASQKYLLDGIVYVNEGQTLTIEPGTVIRAKTGQEKSASALVVARGAKIIAKGTPEAPIIFTVEGDDLQGSVPAEANGLWGGVIILGAAPVNTTFGEQVMEGIPFEDLRRMYGGTNENDNSGVLEYVSIRHGGTQLSKDHEINGLTLGGVGNQTKLEYVEVISTRDDGFEFFGGTVNGRYLLSAFCGDDAFDFDLGYTGNCQFIVGLQAGSTGDLLMEFSDNEGTPATRPHITNGTFIGRGMDENGQAVSFNNSSSGIISNSLFLHQKQGILIEYSGNQLDSYQQFIDGKTNILNNAFYMTGNNSALNILGVYSLNIEDVTQQDENVSQYFGEGSNILQNPQIDYNPQEISNMTLVPKNNTLGALYVTANPWFQVADFKGALGQVNWLKKWSFLDLEGLLNE